MIINRRSIVSNIAYLFSASAGSQALTAVALLLTARQLGPEAYGQYTACIVLVNFASIAFSLGLNIWFVHQASRQPSLHARLFGSVVLVKLSFGLIWAIVTFGLASLINSNAFPKDLLRVTILVVLFDNLFITMLAPFRASLRNQVASIFMIGSDLAWVLATIYLNFQGEDQAIEYMRVRVLIMLFSALIAGAFIWRTIHPQPQTTIARRAIRETLPFAASEFLLMSSMRIDVLIVAMLLGKTATGLYAPSVSLVNALFLPLGAVSSVMMPVLSNLFTQNIQQAWITARRSIWLHLALGVILSLSLVVSAPYLIALLGTRFAGSLEILYIISTITLFHSISIAMTNILIATQQQSQRAIIQAISVFFTIVMDLIVAQRANIRGVAIVYVVTELFLMLGYIGLVLRYRSKHAGTPANLTLAKP